MWLEEIEWIKIEDRKPKQVQIFTVVLLLLKYSRMVHVGICGRNRLDVLKGCANENLGEITHWAYLPAYPKNINE